MTNAKILQRDAPVLRETARNVPVKDIGSKKICDILKKMKEALHAEEDGVAIAAPQIGESLRIFVVNSQALALASRSEKIKTGKKLEDLVFINPEITKTSKKKRRMEEGCLSVRWLYGQVKRSEKVTLKAYDETGKSFERGASGLLAQVFQHETDHLDGILFIDKAENVQEILPSRKVKFVFFGSLPAGKAGSRFSDYVLEELEDMGFSPMLKITSAKEPLPMEKLKNLGAEVFVVASFGKILPKELIELPKHKTLNVHPSLLPQLRGASPIQGAILGQDKPGITIIRMDEKMDHGPILAQAKVSLFPWPDHYRVVEEKLGRAGGRILGELLPKWILGEIRERPQDDARATYTKLIKKEDGLLNLGDPAEENLKKVLAYSTWPGAYMFFKNKRGEEVRVIVKDAKVENLPTRFAEALARRAGKAGGEFIPTRVIPAGKKEMAWQDFLRGN